MKQFFKFVFASMVGFLLTSIILLFVVIIFIVGLVDANSEKSDEAPQVRHLVQHYFKLFSESWRVFGIFTRHLHLLHICIDHYFFLLFVICLVFLSLCLIELMKKVFVFFNFNFEFPLKVKFSSF